MSQQADNEYMWSVVVEVGKTIHLLRNPARALQAKLALKFANSLIENDFVASLPVSEKKRLHEEFIPNIAAWLDGDVDFMRAAVFSYFERKYAISASDPGPDIRFLPKRNGIQTGFVCEVRQTGSTGDAPIRFFVKTHQHGPTSSHARSRQAPDAKEMFAYLLLSRIGVGPEVHLIFPKHLGSRKTLYIATKEVCNLRLLSHLTSTTAFADALIQLDLISRLLCLRDCATNGGNCGQAGDQPVIVDFRVETQLGGYAKPDIAEKFFAGNGEFNYTGVMETIVAMDVPAKRRTAEEALKKWNLLVHVEEVKAQLLDLMNIYPDRVSSHQDLDQYVGGVKQSIAYLSTKL